MCIKCGIESGFSLLFSCPRRAYGASLGGGSLRLHPKRGRSTWQVNMRMLHRLPVENPWIDEGNKTVFKLNLSFKINFNLICTHLCTDFQYIFLVCPAWEHPLLCKCSVWTLGLIPLSRAARPLGVTSLSVCVCVLDNGMDGSRITLGRTKESSCARWKARAADDWIC